MGLPQFVSYASTSPVGFEAGRILKGGSTLCSAPHSSGASWRDKKLPAGGTRPKYCKWVGLSVKRTQAIIYKGPLHTRPLDGATLSKQERAWGFRLGVYVHPYARIRQLLGGG